MAFIFKVTTTSSPQTFTIPCQNIGTFNATVDWGDGGPTSSITTYNDADLAHSYATAGQYTITITGTFPNIYFNNTGDKLLVDEVVDLGDVGWTRLDRAFWGCSNMTAFDVGTADTSGVTDMQTMFTGCSGLTSLDLTGLDTSSVTNMYAMFHTCTNLTFLDVTGFNTSLVTNMRYMFHNCSSLTSLNVTSFDTSTVTSMQAMFYLSSSLTSLDVSGFNTASVTAMQSIFQECSSLTSLDVSSFNTASVTTMENMFFGCTGLTSLDLSGFNTANVTTMRSMFQSCSSLTSLDVSGFDTSSVTTMQGMFNNCSSLTSLDVSRFNTANVTIMQGMFYNCSSLTSLDVSGFDTSNVTGMALMFYSCTNLTSLDVSNWDTSSVTTMQQMFYNCTNLTGLQISGWDVSSVTDGTSFLSGANNALSTQEYNNTLRAWSQQSVQSGVTWHFGDATYDETHPDTGYYLDFDGLDDNLILDGTDFGSSTNATLYKTFRGDTADTAQIMFGTTSGSPFAYILASEIGGTSTGISDGAGSPVYREDGTIASYVNRGAVYTALIDNTDHTIGVEEANLSASTKWANDGFYIGQEYSTAFDNTGRLYAWAAVDTRLDGRNRDLLENFMISRKAA